MQDVIGPDDRRRLLALARQTLEARVRRMPLPAPPDGGVFDLPCGAFVSIHKNGALRGCLGRLEPQPLSGNDIALEISVLTPERESRSIDEIEVGRLGLIVEQGYRRGLLLPQVPIEHHWDRATFLEHTCLKAGLPRNAWQHGARLLVFEAEVFGEDG
jgi:uncharacterized protein